jgi:energy-coupling factor transport system ATP-binding protein
VIVMHQGECKLDQPVKQLYPRAHCLKQWGLAVPLEVELKHRLQKRGWPLGEITGKEDLVREIWRLLSKT